MKTPTVIVASAAFLLFSTAAASAQVRSDQKSPDATEATFKSLDRNRDQAISKVEVKANSSLAAAFDVADVNLDGYITKAEYTAFVQRSMEKAREQPTQPQQ